MEPINDTIETGDINLKSLAQDLPDNERFLGQAARRGRGRRPYRTSYRGSFFRGRGGRGGRYRENGEGRNRENGESRDQEGREREGGQGRDPEVGQGREGGQGRDREGGQGRDREGGQGRDREGGQGRDREGGQGRDREGGQGRRGGRGYYRQRRDHAGDNPDKEYAGGEDNRPFRPYKQQLTHFLSIPLNLPPIQEKFAELKQQILTKFGPEPELNIGEDLFQNPAKVHLTFGVMTLNGKEQEQTAIDLLNKCNEDIIKPILAGQPLLVDIKGVDVLLDKFTGKRARVLFARIVDEGSKLQTIADKVVAAFSEAKLLVSPFTDPVKLHVTLMNLTFRERAFKRQLIQFRRGRKTEEEGPVRPQMRFSAQPLIEEYKEFQFADKLALPGMHLSCFHGVDDKGFYKPLAQVNFT